ncbi:hypothetical protein DVA86_20440 [Streptomyces armeniacus]|uniref:Uncharacterized protein n=1 Tax=Streptomyces armeniacus TaxID=83291 RepID=A0A345XSP8_9ACTN|nr:hypothetical protein [Streptomyces armeniacus]AXK34664.1 hypothetical protein DVA86_20440 [Streptomyces armeniacus]
MRALADPARWVGERAPSHREHRAPEPVPRSRRRTADETVTAIAVELGFSDTYLYRLHVVPDDPPRDPT